MSLRLLASGTAALALAASAGHAQLNPADVPVSLGPFGGSASSVVSHYSNPDEVLVIQYTLGIVRSTDGGNSFAPYGTGYSSALRELTRDPSSADRLYALDGDQVLRSENFGATWTALNLTADENLKHVSVSSNGGSLLASDAFNVYLSDDAGANWSTVHSVVPFAGTVLDEVYFAPSNSGIAYVATNKGILRSSDAGQSFAPVGTYTGWAQTMAVRPLDADTIFVGAYGVGLLRSTDGGVNYTTVATSLTTPGIDNPEWLEWELDATTLWYGTLTGVARTGDLGASWELETDGLFPSTPIPLDLDAASDGGVFLGAEGGGLGSAAGGGLYHREANDTAWTHLGFLNGSSNAVAIAGPNGTRVVGLGGGVYDAAPGAKLFPTAWAADLGTDTRTVAVDPADATRWLAGGVGAFLDNAQIAVVTGSGNAATKTFEKFGAGRVEVIEFDPHTSGSVVAGLYPGGFGNSSIVRSSNAGANWTEVAGTAGWATVDLAFDPLVPGRMLQLSENNQWAYSLNGGTSWSALFPTWPSSGPATFLEFDPFVLGRTYRGDAGSGLWTSDDFNNWTSLGVALHTRSELLVHPAVPGLLWVGSASGELLVSTDGGQSFETAWTAPDGGLVGALALDPADGDLLVATVGAATWELPHASPYVDLGGGTLGSGDFAAHHFPSGGLPRLGNASFGLSGDQLLGGAAVALFLGLTDLQLPAVGGTFHVGTQLAFFSTSATGAGDGQGEFTLSLPLPADPFLVGLPLVTQFGAIDPGAADPSGIVLSNAVRTTLLP